MRRPDAGSRRRFGHHGLQCICGEVAEVWNSHVRRVRSGTVGNGAVVWRRSIIRRTVVGLVIVGAVVGVVLRFVVVSAWQGFDRGCVCNVGVAAVGQIVNKYAITRYSTYLGAIRLGAAVDGKRTETDLCWGDVQRRARGGLEPEAQWLHERAVAGDNFVGIIGARRVMGG